MAVGIVACIVSLISLMCMSEARIPGVYTGGSWQSAHATFYGGSDASGTMGMYFISTYVHFSPNGLKSSTLFSVYFLLQFCMIWC